MGLRVFTALFIASLLVGGCTGIEPTETVESTPIEESTETDSDKIAKEPVVSSSFANMQLNPANCQICKDEGELAVDCSTCDEQTEGFLACIISGEDEEERFEFKYSCDPIEKEFFDGKVTLTNLESETTESFQVLFNYDEEEKKYTLSMEEAPHDSIVFQCDELKEACFEMGSDDDHSNDEDEFSCAEDCDFESEIESKFWMDPQYTCALCIDDGNGNMACGCCTGDPAGGTIQCGVSLFVADHSLAIAYRCEPETRTISNVIINLDGESIDERELDLFEGDPVEDPNVCPFFGDFPEPPPAPEPPLPDPEPVPPSPPPPPDDILYDPQYTCSICREGGTNDACYCCTGNPDDDGPLNCGFTFFNDEKNNEHYIDVSYNCLSDGRKISNIVVSKDGIPLEEECKVTPEGLLFCEADGQSFLLTEGNAVEDPLICQYDGSHPEEHGEWLDLDTGVLCVGGPSDPINAECALCTGDETTHLLSCLLVEINQGSTSEIQYTFDPTTKSFLNLIITDNGVPILGNISFDPNQNSYILTEEGDPKEYVFQCGANSWETNLCVMIHQPSPPPTTSSSVTRSRADTGGDVV